MTGKPYSKRETDMLLKRIDENVEEGFRGTNGHLKKLNGQVAKNTEHRQNITGAMWIIKLIGIGNIIAWLINMLI